jgi:hypothetical protein
LVAETAGCASGGTADEAAAGRIGHWFLLIPFRNIRMTGPYTEVLG